MKNAHHKKINTPPNLLKGILISVIGITLSILTITWLIINYQVEQLVVKRTSEYAHSIARIAADSSAEALLSDDQLQLNLLVENVAKDPYIRQATIYSEDGQIASQHPEDKILPSTSNIEPFELNLSPEISQLTNDNNIPSSNQQQLSKKQFIERQKNIPFIEKIAYQGVTAGWFKLEVDRYLLEQDFRASFVKIQLLTGAIALFLMTLLVILIYRFNSGVSQLVNSCQHLLIKNKISPPNKKESWLDAVKTLSESQQSLQLDEQLLRQSGKHDWINSRRIDHVLICHLEFKIPAQQDIQIALDLNQAQIYLEQAIRAFGVQSQGDLLNGCLIPFFNELPTDNNNDTSLNETICFMALIQKLFDSLTVNVKLKACLSRATILQLEDEQELVTGISILGNLKDKIVRLLQLTDFGEIVSLAIPENKFERYASLTPINIDEFKGIDCFNIGQIDDSITQQIARKFNYITRH